MSPELESFLQERVLPSYRDIVLRFCRQMSEIAPEATQRMRGGTEKYYSVPVYRVNRDIVAISPTKTGVTFSFTHGASFDDPHGFLKGSGKKSRNIRVSKISNYPTNEMAGFIKQAVALDTE